MKQKIIAAAAALTLGGMAAIGAFAAQQGVEVDEEPTATPGDVTATVEATETPEATETAEPTEEPAATETPGGDIEGDEEGVDGDGERDILGIPTTNPVFEDDVDGDCQKHEAAIKTTPDGTQVRVPCHVVEDQDGDVNAADEADEPDDEDADDQEEADEQEEVEEEEQGDEEDGDASSRHTGPGGH